MVVAAPARRRVVAPLPGLAVALLLCGAGCPTAPPPGDNDAGPAGTACAAVPVGDVVLDGVEGDPGYDEELAALDLQGLPASIPLSALSGFERDLVGFMLDEDGLDAVDRDDAAATDLGRAVLGAFARTGVAGDVDVGFLRRGLHRYYSCARGYPLTLGAFRSDVFDFTVDPIGETIDSRVKGLRRRITRSAEAGVFVAETLLADDTVRETEIILSDRRQDHDLDFLEYDANGDLRSASSFAAAAGGQASGAVPFSCIACHGYRNVSPPPPP